MKLSNISQLSGFNMYISKILVVAKYLLMALIGSSFDLFGFLGMAPPIFWQWATENKMFAIMMTFFFSNMLEAQLVSSGAFEITLNGKVYRSSSFDSLLTFHFRYADLVKARNWKNSSTSRAFSNHRKSFTIH
jgi:hypothetical protein